MSKYKWWLHKKEINKIQNNIDRIANEVLREYPATVAIHINGQSTAQGYIVDRNQTCMMHSILNLNAGDDICVIKHGRIIYRETVLYTDMYDIMTEVQEDNVRMIIRETGDIYESRTAS